MAEEANKAEIADALAAELGVENVGDSEDMSSEANDFYTAVRMAREQDEAEPEPEPTAEAPEPETEKFVFDHDGVHKEFESREELLAYESGRKSNEIGELRAKLEAFEKLLDGAGAEPAQPQQMDPAKQEEILLKRALEGTGVNLDEVDAGAYKTIFKMIENALGMYDSGVVNKRFDDLRGSVEKITTRAQEAEALNAAGIQADQVKQALEKHPYLKSLPPGERVAVIADLTRAQAPKQGKPETDNALRQALQPNAANHVEGSVESVPPADYEKAMSDEFFKMDDAARMKALGKMLSESDIGARMSDSHV